ncbi:hypothetical protein HN51_016604 [Arachis hypogaea]|uniref:CASP-like protein n=2 Tax=Arachis TaxID=3817 RepID=A0A445CTU6_ARAHY|nr:CASP-like protein 1F2 [Arachis duranensis]XP_025605964.1 CASP-like protein 1F2 [Arachis hypogaea]XP_057718633.1 CASP-like protein 1F2 [Arachis stenosperma]QHO47203.1 CASP-like protein [Arachis hypogaea]RYR54317.1 hypothetical protein Ahy_A06g029575 [Arachis hypogaea]
MADPKSHYSMAIQPQQPPSSVTGKHRILITAPNFLRLLSILFSAASIAVMVTSNQTVSLFSLSLEAHFYYSSAFKYFVAANSVVCLFTLLTLILNFLLGQQLLMRRDYYFYLFTHDMVVTVLLMSGCAAATAVGYVGQYGQDHMGWQPLCDHVAKFCRSTLVSILLSYFSFFSYFALSLLEAYSSISSPFPSPH